MSNIDTPRYIARFVPQAWINDYAVEIDHGGPDEWDATAFMNGSDDYLADFRSEVDGEDFGEVLDACDWLMDDPNAPTWVQEHRGPFDIYVRLA